MAYTELIKNFNRIRDYMREFYVYGFKSRDGFTQKSARSYDDERRRLESWLGDYMQFRQTPAGKTVFLSVDSRLCRHNPLYKAWKTKSFTDGDITLHFILMDIMAQAKEALSVREIMEQTDAYLSGFPDPRLTDESTLRKKLREYVTEGILTTEKHGKSLYYKRTPDTACYDTDVLDFFSEVSCCGVIGSFLLDKADFINGPHRDHFAFKHHYITGAMDSEIVCQLLLAMQEKRSVTLITAAKNRDRISESRVIPLRIMISVQNGRQYLMAFTPGSNRIRSFRTDHILSVTPGEVSGRFDELREKLNGMRPHMWGVSTQSRSGRRTEEVTFTVRYEEDEPYIHQRLEREKRCGTVERVDACTSRFSASVYDASELIPWIRTFLCRITEIHFSNAALEAQFKEDIREMYRLYGLEGGESV